VRLLKEPTRRIRFLTQEQAVVLLRELPEHLKDIVTFALATGLRAANMTGLTWEQVDLPRKQAWVHPDQAKARRAIPVPFNAAALAVVIRQQGKHPLHVFTYEGNPVKQVSTLAWYKALRRAGIEAFRFYDLRHTWASWHVQNGTPLHVLQEPWGLGDAVDGASVCALGLGSLGRLCREGRTHDGHKSVTATAGPKNRRDRKFVKSLEIIGSLGWNRTNDQRINSPTLYR